MKSLTSLAERTLASYIQAFVGLLLVGTRIDISTAQAAAVAAITAAVTVVANAAASATIPVGQPFWVDLVFRALKTYVAAFLAFVAAIPTFRLDWSIAVAANTAALPALLSVVKSAIAGQFGDPDSAALLPVKWDTDGYEVDAEAVYREVNPADYPPLPEPQD